MKKSTKIIFSAKPMMSRAEVLFKLNPMHYNINENFFCNCTFRSQYTNKCNYHIYDEPETITKNLFISSYFKAIIIVRFSIHCIMIILDIPVFLCCSWASAFEIIFKGLYSVKEHKSIYFNVHIRRPFENTIHFLGKHSIEI